jgi:hypothetical protein
MSIKKVEMFTVICDNCGKSADEGSEYSCWNEDTFAEVIAMESGWLAENDLHYCPDCFDYDDEDNLVIKTQKPQQPHLPQEPHKPH